MYRYILFDLDGTLTDPKVGICTCVQHALGKLGIVEEDLDKLEPFIGPPLDESFRDFYSLSDEDIKKAIGFYRERYSDVGKFENEVYPGIPELLRDLKRKGRTIAIASSKPTDYVEDILEHFEIRQYFDAIVGSNMDGTRSKKSEVIDEALHQLFPETEPEYDEIVMIGDRKFDIESALQAGIRNIGVGYGYGSREELEAAGADKIVNTVSGLRATLLPMVGEDSRAYQMRTQTMTSAEDGSRDGSKGPMDYKSMAKEANKKSFANMWGMLGPVVTYKVGAYAAFFALWTFAILTLGEEIVEPRVNQLVSILTPVGAVILCLFLVKSFLHLEKKEKESGKEAPKLLFKSEPVIWGIALVLVTIGLNGMSLLTDAQQAVEGATETLSTHEMIATLPLWLIILLYGIMMPIVEQFIYTGFAYRRALRFMQPSFAFAVMIFLFGFTKNYTIEGLAGFVVYAIVLYAFSRYPKIWYAMLLHVIASTLVQLQDYCGPIGDLFKVKAVNSLPSAAGFTMIAIMIFMANKKSEDTKKE